MRKLLIAACAVFFVTVGLPAYADGPTTPDWLRDVSRAVGDEMSTATSATATSAAFNFGFKSKYVVMCITDASSKAYFRFGTSITGSAATAAADTTGLTLAATSSTNFIDGATSVLAGSAMPMEGEDSGLGNSCHGYPWKTRGLVMHTPVTGSSTVDVWAF